MGAHYFGGQSCAGVALCLLWGWASLRECMCWCVWWGQAGGDADFTMGGVRFSPPEPVVVQDAECELPLVGLAGFDNFGCVECGVWEGGGLIGGWRWLLLSHRLSSGCCPPPYAVYSVRLSITPAPVWGSLFALT